MARVIYVFIRLSQDPIDRARVEQLHSLAFKLSQS